MKIRKGFVSNSSSSSFVIISVDETTLYEDGDTEMEHCGTLTIPIEELIATLQEAQANGHKKVCISHGGGYEG